MTCSAGGTCQCNHANQYWSSSLKKCLIYRGYGESCDSDASPIYLCKTGLTCQLTPTCMCPQTVGNSSCDCLITQYWDNTSKHFKSTIFPFTIEGKYCQCYYINLRN